MRAHECGVCACVHVCVCLYVFVCVCIPWQEDPGASKKQQENGLVVFLDSGCQGCKIVAYF